MSKDTTYTPSKRILEKYAKVMVHYAVGGGKGVKPGDVVRVVAEEETKPLYTAIVEELYKSGAHVISGYMPSDNMQHKLTRKFFEIANNDQLDFFPKHYFTGLAKEMNHQIYIHTDTDKKVLEGISPKKIMQRGKAVYPFRKMLDKKENKGEFSWTLCMYGSKEMADEVGLSLEQYWKEIIKACYLNKKDPVSEWRAIAAKQEELKKKLNKLKVDKYHIKGKDVDLFIKQGKDRRWLGGGGANIPSFELFTSPDWRGTEGWIKFSEPLYRYGNLIKGIELWFEKGIVVKSKATQNENILKEMISSPNADKVGEFSLTDKRFSKITKFMGETLFDENVGGRNGNTHIALGNAYKSAYKGDSDSLKAGEWKKIGFNESPVHTDIVSTTPRVVTAILTNGKEKVIYEKGQFVI
jgi:aminopeptidase